MTKSVLGSKGKKLTGMRNLIESCLDDISIV